MSSFSEIVRQSTVKPDHALHTRYQTNSQKRFDYIKVASEFMNIGMYGRTTNLKLLQEFYVFNRALIYMARLFIVSVVTALFFMMMNWFNNTVTTTSTQVLVFILWLLFFATITVAFYWAYDSLGVIRKRLSPSTHSMTSKNSQNIKN